MENLQLPPIDYGAIAPMLVLFGVACLGVLVEAFVARRWRYRVQVPLTLLGLVAALVALVVAAGVAVLLFVLLSYEQLDPGAVEREVAAQFQDREAVPIDLSCPADMRVEQDATYECTGTTEDGEDVTLQITITDEDTAAYTWTEP